MTTSSAVWRFRVAVVAAALTAVGFRQSPGLIVPDTKLDLTADPWGFLGRALHLWDPQGSFGQLQNQAYGYLFPVGPFHAVLGSAGVPAWVVQRLWWSTILVVALVGVWRLARALGVRDGWAALFAATAYALSPRLVEEVSITSVEVWPMALAPWVLLPLVLADRSSSWRATRSGLAVALIGGVNAVASLAALVPAVLWLVTRRWTPAWRGLVLRWSAGVALATLWWVLPLLMLGRYSPPFLDWIENAAVTTGPASAFEGLRGTSPWLGFLATSGGPSWPAGWLYVTVPVLVVATSAMAAAGLLGLVWRPRPETRVLLLMVAVGLGLVTLGHTGPGSAWWAGSAQSALDGVLAPLRNSHKFELVVQLPLAVGLGFAVEVLRGLAGRLGELSAVPRRILPVVLTSLLLASAAPALGASMARPEGYTAIPDHWVRAAEWLDAQPESGAVLITPGSSFADFTWGSTKDEPFQALMHRPVVVRDAVPLGSAGQIRLLDGIENRLGEGQPIPGLADVLGRAGVGFVVVRNDLRTTAAGSPPLAVVRALEWSGLPRAAIFGPSWTPPGESADHFTDFRTVLSRPALEVFAVPHPRTASIVPVDALVTANGGPEDLLRLAEAQAGQTMVLGGDIRVLADAARGAGVAQPTRSWLTDGLRRREVSFGAVSNRTSGLLTPDDPGRSMRRVIDVVADPMAPPTVLHWDGVASVTASSSASDATATLRLGPAYTPSAAVDGDPATRWVSGHYGAAVGEWLRIDFTEPTSVSGLAATFSGSSPIAAGPSVVAVETQQGSITADVIAGVGRRLPSLPGLTRWVRIRLVETDPGVQNGFAIEDVTVPAVTARASAALPQVDPQRQTTGQAPERIVLGEGMRGRSDCLTLDGQPRCSPTLRVDPEELSWARTWTSGADQGYAVTGTVMPLSGAPLEKLLTPGPTWQAKASSRLVDAASGRPGAAIDGDPRTTWTAASGDADPWFQVVLPEPAQVSGVRVVFADGMAASRPTSLAVDLDGGVHIESPLDDQGRIVVPRTLTRSVLLHFPQIQPAVTVDPRTGQEAFAPVGLSEVQVDGAEDLFHPVDPTSATGVPCGFGPSLTINERVYQTSVAGTVGDLLEGRPLSWRVCGTGAMDIPEGTVHLAATRSGEFRPSTLTLTATTSATSTTSPTSATSTADAASAPAPVTLERPTASELVLHVPERATDVVLVVPQNANPGWGATTGDGAALTPVRLDGWQQGWLLPAGPASVVTAAFGPDRWYRVGLLVGALALLTLLGWGVRSRHRDTVLDPADPATVAVVGGSSRAVILAALGCVALVGGVGGVLALLLAVGLAVLLREGREKSSRRGALLRPVAAVLVLGLPTAAAVAVGRTPWPAADTGRSSWLVQLGVWTAIALACVLLVAPRTHDINGRSTTR